MKHRLSRYRRPLPKGIRIETRSVVFARRRCRVCGCTNNRACPGGCSWVAIDLCSRCAVEIGAMLAERKEAGRA